ncbi:ABC transporter permease [bacterium]|nr:ABC transporter permease [bacterium]
MTDRMHKDPEAFAVEAEGLISRRKRVWRELRHNRLARISAVIIVLLYVSAAVAGFMSPVAPNTVVKDRIYAPPMMPHFSHNGKLTRPFVYDLKMGLSEDGMERVYTIDQSATHPIRLFAKGEPYKLIGLIPTERHLVSVPDIDWRPIGADRLGRDLLSRIFHGARVSLTIGLIGVAITTIIGTLIGAVSGYFGGWLDNVMQRSIELLMSFPSIPLWIALAAALPATWGPTQTYLGIVIILSLIGWGGLARQIRGLVLSYRGQDYVKAAETFGGSHAYIIVRHLVPNCVGYLVVVATLAIPGTILGETALSFLGLGVRPPMISWGTLLEDAQKVRVLVQYPWLLLPAIPVLITVVSFNMLGDGLRDALDPKNH